MCGIAGIYHLKGGDLPPFDAARVLSVLRHRGPDDEGTFAAPGVFLGARRLSIIDVGGGHQPVQDETGRFHLVMNGEIYDYDRLLDGLRARGHVFRSKCDTEVAVHLFDEKWEGALDAIDGQYAIAVHDARERRLLLARDRMGIAPLFTARVGDLLLFASEMKALFATGLIAPRIDPRGLDAVLALGCVPAPRTMFQGVRALPPGHYLEARDGEVRVAEYWDIPYPDAGDYEARAEAAWAEEFRDLLAAAARRRLKADVPVGVYLSGGIDSATVAALVRDTEGIRGRVFSVGFPEAKFDESAKTKRIADDLGLETHFIFVDRPALARDLPRLIHHAETPLLLTESVPLMALSGLAASHVKVVLTGEGSDELMGGYDYFRWEAFTKKYAAGRLRPRLLDWTRRFLARAIGEPNPFFPGPEETAWADEVFGFYPAMMVMYHYWRMVRGLVYSDEMLRRPELSDADLVDLPRERMRRWDHFNRSLYVSSRLFMAGHLLAAHGDRALMANSVEGRYPFLDRTVQEFVARVPPALKTRPGMEKTLLRRAMKGALPREVLTRRKKPFQAPVGTPFVGENAPDYAREFLDPRRLKESGYFDPAKVAAIAKRLETPMTKRNLRRGLREFVDSCALTFVLTTQMLDGEARSGAIASAS